MKFLYFTDPHGKRSDYWNALSFAIANDIQIIVCGGDLFPKENTSWSNLYHVQKRFIQKFFPEFLAECQMHNIHFITIMGNDDLLGVEPHFIKICEKFNICHNINRKKITLNNWDFIGFDLVNDLPFLLKDRVRRDTRKEDNPRTIYGVFSELNGTFKKTLWHTKYFTLPSLEEELKKLPAITRPQRSIFISHQPPYGTGLSIVAGKDTGSKSIRDYILTHNPLISLHGHIHETIIWYNTLGKTLCIQPGSIQKTVLVVVEILATSKINYKKIIL